MKFRTYTDRGDIAIDATVEERRQLVDFISKSLATQQVDFDEHAPVDFNDLHRLRTHIKSQLADDSQALVLPRQEFWQLVKVASTWHRMGYESVTEGVELDVPRVMVDHIRAVGDDVPMYIGPPPEV